MLNKFLFISLLTTLLSCSQIKKKEYIYPRSNPYPEIFEIVKDEHYGDLLKTKIKASTIKFECTERNDQPYYWCGIDGELERRTQDLPSKLETIFHVQLPKWGVRNVKSLLRKIQKRSDLLTMIIHRDPKIDTKRNAFWNQLFLFFDKKSCVAFLNTENHCPKETRVENIYLKLP